MVSPLGTYQLLDPHGKPLVNLINGQRLIRANIMGNVDKLWTSPFMKTGLRKAGIEVVPPSQEVQQILETDGPVPPTYDELATAERHIKRPSTKPREPAAPAHKDPATVEAPIERSSTKPRERAAPSRSRPPPSMTAATVSYTVDRPSRAAPPQGAPEISKTAAEASILPAVGQASTQPSRANHEAMVPSKVGERHRERTSSYNLRKQPKKTVPFN
jgi:hypothetical protein